MKVELRPAQPSPEIRHAWKAAVENYPLRATQLDLSVLSDKEQEEIQSLLSDPIMTYVGIGRDTHLTAANWAMVEREDGFAIWQAQIHSAAALSLQVRFGDFDLGLGMSVKVYGLGGGGGTPVGEYTGRGSGNGGKFWSLAALGDTVVVEYWLPAEFKVYPDDFPFKVERISHSFRDEEGKLSGVNVRHLAPRRSTCGIPDPPDCSANSQVAKGVARYRITDSKGSVSQCTGSLLNNMLSDGALYFLTAFHCIDKAVGGSSEAKGASIDATFQFRYDNCRSASVSGSGATFVAGSKFDVADWALLRIDGDLSGGSGGDYTLLGWNAANLSTFTGYSIHHENGQRQRLSLLESNGLGYVESVGTNNRGNPFSVFLPCLGASCSHFSLQLEQRASGGASGAPVFSDSEITEVVGVYTNGNDVTCAGHASRFSKMYEDGRVQGALTYGADYLSSTSPVVNFDDSARPDYNPVPPVIKGDTEIVVGAVNGSTSLALTLRAEARYASFLRWDLLADSSPSVTGSSVRFLVDKGETARLVYEVPGGVTERDQFSVQVSSAGGSDTVTIRVRLIGEPLTLPPECEGRGLETAPGDGAPGNPYQLSSLCQLQDINSQLDAHYRLIVDIDASSSRDWNGGSGFLPIAEGVGIFQIFELVDGDLALRSTYERTLSQYAFSGSFDGDGFSIDGLVVNREEEELVGLFSITDGAAFENVRLLNSEIKGRNGAGALAGVMIRSTVSGFHSRGSVDGRSDVGGLSGINCFGSLENGLVSGLVQGAEDFVGGLAGSHFQGTVSDVSAYALTVSGRDYVGGFFGHDRDSTISESNADIEVSGGDYAGGLTGWSQGGRFSKCFATGAVTGISAVGGLVGWLRKSDVNNSYATASASGADNVGGLVGWSNNEGKISNTYATGAATGTIWVASLVGDNEGEVRNSYASGVVTPVGNGRYVGGLLGENSDPGFSSESFMRTLAQLKCPPSPGQSCLGESSYVGWSEREWDFGDANTLPTIRAQQPVPVIAEGDETALVVAYGSSSGVLTLNAEVVGTDFLHWQLVPGSGSSVTGSGVRFPRVQGTEVRVVYEVPGGIRQEDQFSVQVRGTGGSDEITIHVMLDRPPVISRVFGREVDADDELTVYISPQTREVTLRAIAFDESLGTLEWTIADTSGNDATTARFLPGDAGVNATRFSGTGSVLVLYRRGSTAVTSSSFVITVTDMLGQTDSLRVRMVVDATTPVIVNEGVMTTTRGKTLEVAIPYGSEQLILDLLTSSARAGLVGKQVNSSPTEAQALFLPADGEGVLKVQLLIQSGVGEAVLRIRVSNGSASEEIAILVTREQFPRVRLKVLLGGATR